MDLTNRITVRYAMRRTSPASESRTTRQISFIPRYRFPINRNSAPRKNNAVVTNHLTPRKPKRMSCTERSIRAIDDYQFLGSVHQVSQPTSEPIPQWRRIFGIGEIPRAGHTASPTSANAPRSVSVQYVGVYQISETH